MPTPRKSLAQHVTDGTYRRDRHGPRPGESERDDGVPAELMKPPELKGDAGKIWNTLIGLVKGVAKEADVPLLAKLCRWWVQLNRLLAEVEEAEPGTTEFNRLLIGAGICEDKVERIAAKFGLSPSDRAKLRTSEAPVAPVAKVPTRPRTKLDRQGPPKG